MSRQILTLSLSVAATLLLGACASDPIGPSGFLTNSSNLERRGNDTLMFEAPDLSVRQYRSFIIDPVAIQIDEGELTNAQRQAIAAHMHDALVRELTENYFQVTQLPARGVARVRVAITGVKVGFVPANILPQTRLIGLGLGGASMEAEMLDSTTGEQVKAIVESRLGQRLNVLAGLSTSGDARAVMDYWAKDLRKRLVSAHGTPPRAAGPLGEQTGFISTYSRLEPIGPSSLRYVNPDNRLGRYNKFIVDPVEVFFHESGAVVSASNTERLRQHMRQAIIDALSDRYQIVTAPAWDVAEIRVALTDVKRSTGVLNVIPRPKLTNLALGGMAMEGEVLDSVSSVQLAALIESSLGRNLSFDPSQFDDARAAMNDWARRLRRAVDDAHARAGRRPGVTSAAGFP